jgi:hypothetical protein
MGHIGALAFIFGLNSIRSHAQSFGGASAALHPHALDIRSMSQAS